MPTMHPSAEPLVTDKIPSQESPLSPEWTHAINTLMGHPLSSEQGRLIKKWIIYHRIHKYTMFTFKRDPTQFNLIHAFKCIKKLMISCLPQEPHSQETCLPYELHESAHQSG